MLSNNLDDHEELNEDDDEENNNSETKSIPKLSNNIQEKFKISKINHVYENGIEVKHPHFPEIQKDFSKNVFQRKNLKQRIIKVTKIVNPIIIENEKNNIPINCVPNNNNLLKNISQVGFSNISDIPRAEINITTVNNTETLFNKTEVLNNTSVDSLKQSNDKNSTLEKPRFIQKI